MSEPLSTYNNVPLNVWAVTINRKVTREEFETCLNYVDHKARVKAEKSSSRGDGFRELHPGTVAFTTRTSTGHVIAKLLPSLVVWNEHPNIHASQWNHNKTKAGKEYMDSAEVNKVLGYETACGVSLVIMAWAYGPKLHVINIGIDIMQLSLPKAMNARTFADAYSHKITKSEQVFLDAKLKDEVILRRLCILITIKAAYIKALGQPPGFDYSRVECNIPEETVTVDGNPLHGWEFRLFKVNLGVVRNGLLLEEAYQCATAIFRGGNTVIIWEESPKDMEKWLHFITTDVILANLPRKHSQNSSASGSNSGTQSTSAAGSGSGPASSGQQQRAQTSAP
ncbi:hypothetical protein BU17DRAFT_90069 [Hysterangium stoloniferum]|nr:hypothetical protein BU17DRAFT_90069 [Hysterangium stoloniferum]